MKFIICDYASHFQTEPYYLNACINLLDGCSSVLWQHSMCSIYDILDHTDADIFVCHASTIPQDIISYIKENKKPEIILNISNIPEKQVISLEDYLLENNVKCTLFFSNTTINPSNVPFKTKTITVHHGADVFLDTEKTIDYSIDSCYIINDDKELARISAEESYHTLSLNKSMENKVDAVLNIASLGKVYKNYKQVVFKDFDENIPQVLFDSIYYANMVKHELDTVSTDRLNGFLKSMFKVENIEDYDAIKAMVQTKHTCINRTKSILSQLPCQQQIKNLDKFIELYKDRTNKT